MDFPKIPLNTKPFPAFQTIGAIDSSGENDGALLYSRGKPFFNILTDNSIAALFLEAVAANPDEAMAFVSKHSAGAIDFEALRDALDNTNQHCTSWVQASYSSDPKNCMTRSVMLVDPDKNIKRLLHLHMIREPDRYGQWKIYGVEQE